MRNYQRRDSRNTTSKFHQNNGTSSTENIDKTGIAQTTTLFRLLSPFKKMGTEWFYGNFSVIFAS
jgi:hypothetical protein